MSKKLRSRRTSQTRALCHAIALLFVVAIACAPTASAQNRERAYDADLFRLAEILGGIHYLRALCGHNDGQTWRQHMEGLIKTEGTSAFRRALLARRFNQGYRSYSRTYKTCTVTAKAALERFIDDAKAASKNLLATRGDAVDPPSGERTTE
ncbi:MAG: TIGR02301 family protein [Pseudomonadota bacterium]